MLSTPPRRRAVIGAKRNKQPVKGIYALACQNHISSDSSPEEFLNSGQDFPLSSHISPLLRRPVYEIRNLGKEELTGGRGEEVRRGRKKTKMEGRRRRAPGSFSSVQAVINSTGFSS